MNYGFRNDNNLKQSYLSQVGTNTMQKGNNYGQLFISQYGNHNTDQRNVRISNMSPEDARQQLNMRNYYTQLTHKTSLGQISYQPNLNSNYPQLVQNQPQRQMIQNQQFPSNPQDNLQQHGLQNYLRNNLNHPIMQNFDQMNMNINPNQQPLIINGPIQKHVPLFIGPKKPNITKHSMFTPIKQTRDRIPDHIKKAIELDWKSYPNLQQLELRDQIGIQQPYQQYLYAPVPQLQQQKPTNTTTQLKQMFNNPIQTHQVQNNQIIPQPLTSQVLRQLPIVSKVPSSASVGSSISKVKSESKKDVEKKSITDKMSVKNEEKKLVQKELKNKGVTEESEEDDESEESEESIKIVKKEPIKKPVKAPPPVKAQVVKAPPEVKKVIYKNKAQRQLKIFFIRFSFIIIYFVSIKRIILIKKKRAIITANESVSKAFELSTEWALTFLDQFLQKFWQTSDKYDWIIEEKISEKEIQARTRRCKITVHTVRISKKHEYEQIKDGHLQLSAYKSGWFYDNICSMEFRDREYSRNRNPIRVYYYQDFMKGLIRNCNIVTSILHELILSEFRTLCPTIKDNQKHLAIEDKIQPRLQGPLKNEADPRDPNERTKQRQAQEPLIHPVYTRQDMAAIFKNDQEWVENSMDKLDEFYERITKIVNDQYKKEKSQIKKGRLIEKIVNLNLKEKY